VLVVVAGLTVAHAGFELLAVRRLLYCTLAVKVLDSPGLLSRRVDGLTLSGTDEPTLASSGGIPVGSELQALRRVAAASIPAANGETSRREGAVGIDHSGKKVHPP